MTHTHTPPYKYIITLGLILLLSSTPSHSQEKENKKDQKENNKQVSVPKNKEKADKKYNQYAYIDAIKMYEKMAQNGYRSQDIFEKLGNAYYYNAELTKSAKWYKELFSMGEDSLQPEQYYRYAQSLKAIGDYDKANQYLDKFQQKSSNDLRGKKYTQNKNYLEKIKANSGRYDIDASGINSQYSDYGSTSYNGYVVFTSSRDTGGIPKRRHQWTNQSFTNLYVAKQDKNGKLSQAEPFISDVKSKYHESTPVITKDGKTIYFTRNNSEPGKKGTSQDKIKLLKIYQSTNNGKKWSEAKALPFNSNNYNCAHPALSPDEKTLYFASDMPGGKGQSDLYKVKIENNGSSFGTPENLGEVINTEGRETFPYITQDNEIYFASDGHPGLGGLDIFATRKEKDSTYQTIHNVGSPVNGPLDDFAFSINNQSKRGYFSSNRPGKGYDDIYNLLETRSLFVCEQLIAGKVTNEQTGEAIAGAEITLYDTNFKEIGKTTTDQDGNYKLNQVVCGMRYYVRASKPNHHTQEQYVSVPEERGETPQDFKLEQKQKEIPIGTDLFELLNLKPILFNLDKSNIRPDAALELDKVVAVLKEYPNMKIDVRSHTDSRGKDAYNEKLSDRRAQSTREYMLRVGAISSDRITAKGYGEYKLKNKCTNGVKCTDEEHQENRRSEFIVLEM